MAGLTLFFFQAREEDLPSPYDIIISSEFQGGISNTNFLTEIWKEIKN
jgi:hypothetical protein